MVTKHFEPSLVCWFFLKTHKLSDNKQQTTFGLKELLCATTLIISNTTKTFSNIFLNMRHIQLLFPTSPVLRVLSAQNIDSVTNSGRNSSNPRLTFRSVLL